MSESRHRSVARQELERLRMDLAQRQNATARLNAENSSLVRGMEHIREDERQKRYATENALRDRVHAQHADLTALRNELDRSQAVNAELRLHLENVERENADLRHAVEQGRAAAVRVAELTRHVDKLVTEKGDLQEELKGAVKADQCRVLEGKVEGLTKLLDERDAADDANLQRISTLLEELSGKSREVDAIHTEAATSERLVGEYSAVVEDLRLKLRSEKQVSERAKERAKEDVTALRKKVDERDAEIRRLATEASDALHDMRQERRNAAECQVQNEELRSELSMAHQNVDQMRGDLAEARRLEAAATDRWRQSQLVRETSESQFAKERVVASSQAAEIKQLQTANATLEGVCEGLRVDLRQSQRQLDNLRTESNQELERLRVMLADTSVKNRMLAASSGAPAAAVLGGVVSPARPMKL